MLFLISVIQDLPDGLLILNRKRIVDLLTCIKWSVHGNHVRTRFWICFAPQCFFLNIFGDRTKHLSFAWKSSLLVEGEFSSIQCELNIWKWLKRLLEFMNTRIPCKQEWVESISTDPQAQIFLHFASRATRENSSETVSQASQQATSIWCKYRQCENT